MNKFTKGFISGLAATIPMTILMSKLYDHLPEEQQHPLPPRIITENLFNKFNFFNKIKSADVTYLTWLSHLGYGAGAGLIYRIFFRQKSSTFKSLKRGGAYGFLVWSMSYILIMPSLKLIKPVHKETVKRNSLMLTANIFWGMIMALLSNWLTTQKKQNSKKL